MIVDFISLKNRLDKYAYGRLKGVHLRESSFLNLMRRHIIHEGHKSSYQTVDNETVPQNLERIDSVIRVSRSEIRNLRFQQVLDLYEKMASDIVNQQHKLAIQRINETVASVGNVIDGSGKKFSEATLEMLEKLHIDFEDIREKPQLPTMVVHPDTAERLREEEHKMSNEEKIEHERKRAQILDRKYEEYILRESYRKLVE
jgi:hypothetical protein